MATWPSSGPPRDYFNFKYSDVVRKIPNHVIAIHERGGINKRRGGFNNSLTI